MTGVGVLTANPPQDAPRRPVRGILTVELEGRRHTFEFKKRAIVGRDETCDIVLASRMVSRRHAELEERDGRFVVRDLGSGNGTFLDGAKVTEGALAHGDGIRFGEVHAVFEIQPEVPDSGITKTITQTLRVKPAPKARPLAASLAITFGVALLVLVTAWERGCLSP